MENMIMEIKAISQTLETLDIRPTISNMDKLLGCQQHLATVAEELEKKAKELEKKAGEQNGNSDPE